MQGTDKGNFGEGKVGRLILSQALPLTVAQLVQVLYNVVDRVYIGHIPGDESGLALTGVGLTFPLITLVAAFINLFSTGGAPLCAMARGCGDDDRAARIEAVTLTMQLCVGAALTVAMLLVMRPLLFLFGASEATYPFARQYLLVYLLGTVFLSVGTGMNRFINLQGFPRIGMLTTVIGAALNLVLDPLFIFALHLGVTGAALATVLSQLVSAVWVLRFLFGKKAVVRIGRRDLFRFDLPLIRESVTLGLSGFIMSATTGATQAVCNATLSLYGGDLYIGVMTIINSVREIVTLPVNALTYGSQPILSYNYGAQRNKRVRQGIRFTSLAGLVYTLLAWALIMCFPEAFMRLFTPDATIWAAGRAPMLCFFMGFFMMSFQFAGQSTFVALGRSKKAIFFSLLRKVIIVIPLTVLLPKNGGLGVMGVFLAEPISNFLGGLACFLTMMMTEYRKL